ncbi:MAG: GTPase Era [Gammaproteobacteria bacterium]|nr:GTPase Era [Gammaproteobacteria bacterium]
MQHHCGFVTIVGRPNVGKPTLLNRFLGQKLSITSRRPQTTRAQLLGIKSDKDNQVIYIDTPGLQRQPGNVFNRYMNRQVLNALIHVDVVVHVIEALIWTDLDKHVLELTENIKSPVILALNKIDRVKNKKALLPFIDEITKERSYAEVVPFSARSGDNLDILEQNIRKLLPPGPPVYPEDQITDKNERFFAAEYIREKLTRRLGAELPYNISVMIDVFKHEGNILNIDAVIWVSNSGQKAIVIGKDGSMLKSIGEQARKELEKMFGKKIFLQTRVKIKEKWTNNIQALKQLGYDF